MVLVHPEYRVSPTTQDETLKMLYMSSEEMASIHHGLVSNAKDVFSSSALESNAPLYKTVSSLDSRDRLRKINSIKTLCNTLADDDLDDILELATLRSEGI
jgi:hypothetical protein